MKRSRQGSDDALRSRCSLRTARERDDLAWLQRTKPVGHAQLRCAAQHKQQLLVGAMKVAEAAERASRELDDARAETPRARGRGQPGDAVAASLPLLGLERVAHALAPYPGLGTRLGSAARNGNRLRHTLRIG
jgi:hypothetical protein